MTCARWSHQRPRPPFNLTTSIPAIAYKELSIDNHLSTNAFLFGRVGGGHGVTDPTAPLAIPCSALEAFLASPLGRLQTSDGGLSERRCSGHRSRLRVPGLSFWSRQLATVLACERGASFAVRLPWAPAHLEHRSPRTSVPRSFGSLWPCRLLWGSEAPTAAAVCISSCSRLWRCRSSLCRATASGTTQQPVWLVLRGRGDLRFYGRFHAQPERRYECSRLRGERQRSPSTVRDRVVGACDYECSRAAYDPRAGRDSYGDVLLLFS